MENFYSISMYILILNVMIALALAIYAWQRRQVQGAHAFFLFILNILFWLLSTVIASLTPTAETADFWLNKIRFIFIATLPIAQLIFVLAYTGRTNFLKPLRIGALFIIPLISQVINWVYGAPFLTGGAFEQHGGFWIQVSYGEVGPWFWVHTGYSYAIIGISMVLLVWHAIVQRYPYRSQALILLAGSLFAIVANLLTIFNLIPNPLPDFTALSFTVSSLIWAYALFQYRLLDIMPIARDLVIESMEDAILVLDYDGRIVDVNIAAQKIINRPLNEIIGGNAVDVLALWDDLIEQFRHTPNADAEIELKIDNKEKTYNLRISPIIQHNQIVGRLISLRDISEIQKLIEELDAYAHTVAHDLKSPLGAAVGYTEILTGMYEDVLSDKAFEMIGRMHNAYDKMRNIINELLLFASIRQDDIKTTPLDMNAIVQGALGRFSQITDETNATITLPDTWPVAMGYPGWIEEVWANFMSNALKYGGESPVIKLGADIKEDGYISFWMKDNGEGLTEEQQADVFDQFTRYHTQFDGQGLGLAIAKRIVEKLNGQICVESTPGEGCTFIFTLPYQE